MTHPARNAVKSAVVQAANTDSGEEVARTYNILVFGMEKKELHLKPDKPIDRRNYHLFFEPLNTHRRIDEFDGVIFFHGLFEKIRWVEPHYTNGYWHCSCDESELHKRVKEVSLLLEKGGLVCVLLSDDIIDYAGSRDDIKSTDLSKYCLNYNWLNRKNFKKRTPNVQAIRNEFTPFIKRYSGAHTYFENYQREDCWRVIAQVGDDVVGMILLDQIFVVPTLLPDNRSESIEEFFTLLADAVTSTANKLVQDVPSWAAAFTFSKEQTLQEHSHGLKVELQKTQQLLSIYAGYKNVLTRGDERLVGAVKYVLENGFGFKVNPVDEHREDLKIIDGNGSALVFIEVKGVNKSVAREYVNQADSHRERAKLSSEFPTLLIVNTHIKNARSIKEKDQAIANEQIKHAAKQNVLIIRTLDLLRLLENFIVGKISKDEILQLFGSNNGWLSVSENGEIKILHE